MKRILLQFVNVDFSLIRGKLLIPFMALFFTGFVNAQSSGIFESYAILSINGGANAYYDMQANTGNPDFQGNNLGTFTLGTNTLVVKGGENKTFKNGGCNINSSRINYRIFKVGDTPGSFTVINQPFDSNIGGNDQKWVGTSGVTNLISGLVPGTYTLELFSEAGFDSCGSGTHFSNNGGANYIASFTVAGLTWTGATSASWNVATNWSPAAVPSSTDDVLINTGTPNAPILDVNYTVGSGKTLTVSGTGSLTVNPTTTLTIAGSAAFNGRPITFKSDATGTGSFGIVTTPANVTGATNVTVERYLTGRRAFRFLTPSVTTTTSIFTNWQNAGANTAGIGTHITGSTIGANGFDATTTGNPSMFTYNAQATGTTTGFTAVPNTDVTTLTAGAGYRILVRGDRNVDLTAASNINMNVPTTLSSRGILTVGTVTFDSSGASPAPVNNQAGNTQTNGFTLIGNPYASPVDWHAVTKTGVAANAYYTWDPTLGTSTQRGRYVVYSQDSGTANLFDDNSGLPLNSRQYLQTGQAVFIKNANLATPATLVFNEANKASVNQYVFRNSESALTSTNSSLYLSVYEPNELALGGNAIDGAAALFGADYTTALDNNDVEKLVATGENLAFVRSSKNLAIETVAPVQPNDVLFVKTIAFQANKNYTFKLNTQNFDASATAKMVDMYLNTETPLDVTQPSFVTFSTTADANSYGSERFKIVFNSTALENDDFATNAISVYPNPIVNNQFNIALPSSVTGTVNVSITNMLGQEVYKSTNDATQTMLVRPNQPLQEGVYVVSVNNNGKVMQTKVIVKN